MEKGWEKVFESKTPVMAEIIKTMLLDNEIPAVVLNKVDSSINVLLPGKAEVYVPLELAADAINLIETSEDNHE